VLNTYCALYYYAKFLGLDQEPPVFTYCPSDIAIDDVTTPEHSVEWQEPTITDNSGVSPSVSSNRQSGALFAVPGSYEVLYVAIDASGNEATCSFRITLKRKYGASSFQAPRWYAHMLSLHQHLSWEVLHNQTFVMMLLQIANMVSSFYFQAKFAHCTHPLRTEH